MTVGQETQQAEGQVLQGVPVIYAGGFLQQVNMEAQGAKVWPCAVAPAWQGSHATLKGSWIAQAAGAGCLSPCACSMTRTHTPSGNSMGDATPAVAVFMLGHQATHSAAVWQVGRHEISCSSLLCCAVLRRAVLWLQGSQQQPSQAVIDQVRDAAMSWGFFQLVNHGVSQQLLDEHYEVMKQ